MYTLNFLARQRNEHELRKQEDRLDNLQRELETVCSLLLILLYHHLTNGWYVGITLSVIPSVHIFWQLYISIAAGQNDFKFGMYPYIDTF